MSGWGGGGCPGQILSRGYCPDTANELPLHLRREKLALQFAIKIADNPNNPVYDSIFNPRYVDLFSRKPTVIPTFGIRIKESLEELDFDPDIIAKFEFLETPP